MSLAVCPSSPAAILNAVSELESLRAQRAILVQQKQAADARKNAADAQKSAAESKKSAADARLETLRGQKQALDSKKSQSVANRAALADLMKLVQAAPTRPSAGTTAVVAKKTLA